MELPLVLDPPLPLAMKEPNTRNSKKLAHEPGCSPVTTIRTYLPLAEKLSEFFLATVKLEVLSTTLVQLVLSDDTSI